MTYMISTDITTEDYTKVRNISEAVLDALPHCTAARTWLTTYEGPKYNLQLKLYGQGDLKLTRARGSLVMSWVVRLEDIKTVIPKFIEASLLNVYLSTNSHSSTRQEALVSSFVLKFKSGQIAFAEGVLFLREIKDIDLLIEEVKKLDELFPI